MTGGILQIAARGVEDIFLTNDPRVTFFKTIYRRHTNFSRNELDLNFNSKLTFGKSGYCRLEHYGDLVYRMFISIKLPQIDIFYSKQTVATVQQLLKSVGIIWPSGQVSIDPNAIFNETLNVSAQRAINLKIVQLNDELQIIDNILNTLSTQGEFNSIIWKQQNGDDPVKYMNDILLSYIQYDKYNLQYKLIISQINDTLNPRPLANAIQIQNILLNTFIDYATSEDFNPLTFNDANIQFLYYVDTTNYSMSTTNNSDDVFNSNINKTYQTLQTTYQNLDAYKIFNYTLLKTKMVITNPTQIQNIKATLLNNIQLGLSNNITLLQNVYSILQNDSKFIFYKKYPLINSQVNTNATWVNDSLATNNPPSLNDNFNIVPNPNPLLNNPYEDSIISTVSQFHIDNLNLFKTNKFIQYFNNLTLWSQTDVRTNPITPTQPGLPQNMYFLNYLWLTMTNEILLNISKIQNSISASLITTLTNTKNNILSVIIPIITQSQTYDTIKELSLKKMQHDIMICCIIRKVTTLVNDVTIPEYIVNSYINDFVTFGSLLSGDDLITFNQIKSQVLNIIESYVLDISLIPDYSVFISQNVSDSHIQVSIWNYIFLKFVNNYDGIFNNVLLGYNFFGNNVGSELLEYLIEISNMILNYDVGSDTVFDYYRDTFNLDDVITLLENKMNILIGDLNHYFANRKLLDMRNILVSRKMFLYEKYLIVLNYIVNIIETNPSIYTYDTHGLPNDIVLITSENLSDISQEHVAPRNNALDIMFDLRDVASVEFGLSVIEFGKFEELFGSFFVSGGAENLYKFNSKIMTTYDNFTQENDVYDFMKDYVIQMSFLKDVPGLLSTDVNTTYLNVLNYFVVLRSKNRTTFDKIMGDENDDSVSVTLDLFLRSDVRAKFAWVERIGHYIIEEIDMYIDDQLVTSQCGECIEIGHSLGEKITKKKGYNELIGDVSELTTFDNRVKGEYELIVPIYFWFCKNPGSALPLAALHNAEIKFFVQLRTFEEMSYFEKYTVFKKKPKLICKMISEFIYVENGEREKLVNSKLEYLIDDVQTNGDVMVTADSFDPNNIINTVTRFQNPTKELYWVLQDISNIDGSLPYGQRKWNNYSYMVGNVAVNPIKQASIQFNGRQREIFKDSIFYNYIQPWERHESDPSLGVNIYAFSLDPFNVQSMGTANMSKIDDAGINITVLDEVFTNIMNGKSTFRFAIYSLSINVFRVCSGLGGLMYYF